MNEELTGQIIFKYELDMVHKVSTNEIYAGCHYSKRVKYKDGYRWEMKRVLSNGMYPIQQDKRIHIKFTFIFINRPFDASNCSYMAKLIEDALKLNGVIKDDSIEYVSGVTFNIILGEQNKIIIEGINNGSVLNYQSDRKSIMQLRRKSEKKAAKSAIKRICKVDRGTRLERV